MATYYPHERELTLLEMTIVLAMLGLLMTLAVPSYQRYTQRAKFVEVIQATTPYKIAITLCACQQGDLKLCNTPGKNGIPNNFKNKDSKTGYVGTVKLEKDSVITAIPQRIYLDKKTLFTYTHTPILQDNGALQWTVDNAKTNSCKHYQLC